MTLPQTNFETKPVVEPPTKPHEQNLRPLRRGIIGSLLMAIGLFLTRLFVKLKFTGQENLPKTWPYVLAPNHQTYVDGMWVSAGLPHAHYQRVASVAGADLATKHGFMGRILLRSSRIVPIDREGNPMRGLMIAKRRIREGNILMIHPEGTRTHDGFVGELLPGAAYIAAKDNVPIIPVYISGGYKMFNRFMKWPQTRNPKTGRKRIITITYGEPIIPQNFDSVEDITLAIADFLYIEEKKSLGVRASRAQDQKQVQRQKNAKPTVSKRHILKRSIAKITKSKLD